MAFSWNRTVTLISLCVCVCVCVETQEFREELEQTFHKSNGSYTHQGLTNVCVYCAIVTVHKIELNLPLDTLKTTDKKVNSVLFVLVCNYYIPYINNRSI